MLAIKPTSLFKLSFLFLTACFAFSCKNNGSDDYAKIYYNYAPGTLHPMEFYCKCVPLTDARKKQFQYSFTVKGDSVWALLKHFEDLKPSNETDSVNAQASILLHHSGRVDTLCIGYEEGIKVNGRLMQKNKMFTNEASTLVAQYHGKLMMEKFGKH